jgi:hypothetical protein
VNWQPGEDVIVSPAIDDARAAELFPKGVTSLRPYLRYTPQPD